MTESKKLLQTLSAIADKHAYTHKLAYELCIGCHAFMERKFFELCFVLYVRFQTSKITPKVLFQYFGLLQAIIAYHQILKQNAYAQEILEHGLSLEHYSDTPQGKFSLTNTMLKINYCITSWQNTHHICKYCGHGLDLLTQDIFTRKK